MIMDNKSVYEERIQRMEDVVSGKVPDRVPVYSLIDNWAFSYAGYSSDDVTNDMEKMYQAFKKVSADFYFDSVFCAMTSRTQLYPQALGGGIYETGGGVIQVNTTDINCMEPEEYSEMAKDPFAFIRDVVAPRKHAIFRIEDPEKRYRAFVEAVDINMKYMAFSRDAEMRMADELGMPTSREGTFFHPLDIIMDFFRNMQGTLTDLKRYPTLITEALEALTDMVLKLVLTPGKEHIKGKAIFNPMHSPPFMRKKEFEKFYWPYFLRIINALNDNGFKMMCYFERDYSHLYDYLEELPENCILGMFEDDDLRVVKKRLGDKIAIGGGMDIYTLANGTKEECLDMAKKAVDDLAPGGGYVFTTNRIPYTPGDINPENLRAVNEFVHEYGVYK